MRVLRSTAKARASSPLPAPVQRRRMMEATVAAHAPAAPTADSLTRALGRALQPDVARRASGLAPAVRSDGAEIAARRLLADVPHRSNGS